MKKLLGILVLSLLWFSTSFAEVNKKILGGKTPDIKLVCATNLDEVIVEGTIFYALNKIYGENNLTLSFWGGNKLKFQPAQAIVQIDGDYSKWAFPMKYENGDFGVSLWFLSKNLNQDFKIGERPILKNFHYIIKAENIKKKSSSEETGWVDEDSNENIRLNKILRKFVSSPNTDAKKHLENLQNYNKELGVHAWKIKNITDQNFEGVSEINEKVQRECFDLK